MAELNEAQRLNRELADKLIAEAKGNPKTCVTGQYVGLANGKVVIVTDDLNQLSHMLSLAEPQQDVHC